MSKYRRTQIFSLQLANHDDLFGPRMKLTRWKKNLRRALMIPGLIVLIVPSFHLARQVEKLPPFTLPDVVEAGSAFTVPSDPSLQSVQIEGRALPEIKATNQMFLAAAAPTMADLDVVMLYRPPATAWKPKDLIPKFEHPSFEVFTKRIRVEGASVAETAATAKAASNSAANAEWTSKETQAALALEKSSRANLIRKDGQANATCWKTPEQQIIPAVAAQKRSRNLPIRAANVTSAGNGEVVAVEGNATSGRAVTIYHGGGLYSRYLDLKESKVRKGEKVTAGEAIAVMSAGTWRHPVSMKWDIHLNETALNPEHFLALSTQLCDSK